MKKQPRHLTGLRAYFERKPRPVLKYCTSSEDEESTEPTPSSIDSKVDCIKKPHTSVISSSNDDVKSEATSGELKKDVTSQATQTGERKNRPVLRTNPNI